VLRETISRSGNSGTADTAKQKRRVRSFFVRAARNNFPQQKQRDSGHNETKAPCSLLLCARCAKKFPAAETAERRTQQSKSATCCQFI